MPLQPAQKAAIALWLCSARYLDSECCLAEDPDGLALVVAARGTVEGAASSSELLVRSAAALPPYLVKQADCLAALPQGNAGPEAAAMLRSAEQFLRASARNVRPSETGDGPAITEEGGAPCSCGVLDLAARVETRVRRMLEAEVRLPFGVDPAITYVTALADDDRDFAPFCIDGKVSIRRSPRTVTMVLSSKPITSRDLWHVAYTLHHELVCHAFQGARATRRLPDAHPNCHWSEGWMDTLAFDLTTEWEDAPVHWLPLRGEDAKGELRRFHDHRYVAPARLTFDDVRRRRLARKAYRHLANKLLAHHVAASPKEADDIVRRFSLAANAHPDADCTRLKTLGSKLRILLMSEPRPEAGIAAALACLAFTADHDLEKLEDTIDSASS